MRRPITPHYGTTKSGMDVHKHVTDHEIEHLRIGIKAIDRFNNTFATLITKCVGSMWCAYAFAAFDLLSLHAAINGGVSTIVPWVAQTFLQLVLLSIIMVGQNLQNAASDARSAKTFEDAEETKAATITALDRLDVNTEGGITEILKAVSKLSHNTEATSNGDNRISGDGSQ
jgi:uncharacterized membrane protein